MALNNFDFCYDKQHHTPVRVDILLLGCIYDYESHHDCVDFVRKFYIFP